MSLLEHTMRHYFMGNMLDNRKLKIVWVMPRPNLSGGIKSTKLIAEAMVRRGHDVTIAYVNRPRKLPSLRRAKTFARAMAHRISTRGRIGRHHFEKSTANLLPVDHHRIEPDHVPDADFVVASWWQTVEWISHWPDRKGQKVHFVRGHEALFGGDPKLIDRVYRLPMIKLTNSEYLQRMLREEYGIEESVCIRNGVDRTQFNAPPRNRVSVPTVGFLYGTTRLKGAQVAADAIRLVQKEIPDLRVLSFGARPLKADFVPPDNYEFHLQPDQSVIPELYRRCDCWILPSYTEGLPMPPLEAMGCRCPIVATRCGGGEDLVVEGRNGYLVDVGDAATMADRVLRVLQADDGGWSRMSEASYAISKEYDWDRSAHQLESTMLGKLIELNGEPGVGAQAVTTSPERSDPTP